jgi:hypothetical protein
LTIETQNLRSPGSRDSGLGTRKIALRARAPGPESRHASVPCTLHVCCGRKKLPFAGYSVVKEQPCEAISRQLRACQPLEDRFSRSASFQTPARSAILSPAFALRRGNLRLHS